jgi:hypothetical protein
LTKQGQEMRRLAKAARAHIISTRLHLLGPEALQQLYQVLQQLDTLLEAQFASGEIPALIEQAIELNQTLT